jgi:hypothetical protein
MYAPIVVFAYNRPDHLTKTLTALSRNEEAKDSELYIFIDGPKNLAGKEKNVQVLKVAQSFEKGDFKKVTIYNSETNRGLAKAVIVGVTEIINCYGKVIVTEDDAVCAPSYLSFMNAALDFYQDNPRIWSIGGYTVPMNIPRDYTRDVIFTQRSSSYAWATWKDRWNKVDWAVQDYKKFHWDFTSRKRFNLWGDDRASMLDDQMLGRVNSWAIRFDYAMFKHDTYNVLPVKSLIQNIGHDGSGTHSVVDHSNHDPFSVRLADEKQNYVFCDVQMDERIRLEFIKLFQSSKLQRMKRYAGNLLYNFRKRGI